MGKRRAQLWERLADGIAVLRGEVAPLALLPCDSGRQVFIGFERRFWSMQMPARAPVSCHVTLGLLADRGTERIRLSVHAGLRGQNTPGQGNRQRHAVDDDAAARLRLTREGSASLPLIWTTVTYALVSNNDTLSVSIRQSLRLVNSTSEISTE